MDEFEHFCAQIHLFFTEKLNRLLNFYKLFHRTKAIYFVIFYFK